MQLDERSIKILKEISLSFNTKVNDLKKQFQISRSQVEYSLQKIDDWLEYNDLPPVKRIRNVGLIIDKTALDTLNLEGKDLKNFNQYTLKDNERVLLILIMMLGVEEELSLFHFSSALNVSKNTIVGDLKKLEKEIADFELQLNYSRRDGYHIAGDEWDKRRLLIATIPQALKIKKGENWIKKIVEIKNKEINIVENSCFFIEKRLKIRYTDEKIKEIILLLIVLKRRIEDGHHLEKDIVAAQDILYTKEYQIIEDILHNFANINERDRLFIALYLFSANLSSSELIDEKNNLLDVIQQMLNKFESIACISFQEKDVLASKIYQHVKPSIYRIIYDIYLENPLLDKIKEEYGDIYFIVQKCIDSLENYLKKKIPEEELGYITILVASSLFKQGEMLSEKSKAIVVCSNGISISKLLYEKLRLVFPEIIFLDHISARELNQFKQDFDIVFSTLPIKTDKKLFLVKSFLTAKEIQQIKYQVYREIYGIQAPTIDYEVLVHLIKRHSKIDNEQKLVQSLELYFNNQQMKIGSENVGSSDLTLKDIVLPDYIIQKDRCQSWQDAIRTAAKPLLDAGAITKTYVEKMISSYNPDEPYIIIAPNVAIPHASPEDGVNKIGMSMLCLNEGVYFTDELKINLIAVLAAVDRKAHIKALVQFTELVYEKDKVTNILTAKDKQEILSIIHQASIKEI